MSIPGTLATALIGLALLSGCSHDVNLKEPESKRLIGAAHIEFESETAGTLSLHLHDKHYQGNWEAVKVDESRRIAQQSGMGSRRYQEYAQGMGVKLWEGSATLQSVEGDAMQCRFRYRGTLGRGFCDTASGRVEFVGEA